MFPIRVEGSFELRTGLSGTVAICALWIEGPPRSLVHLPPDRVSSQFQERVFLYTGDWPGSDRPFLLLTLVL